MTDTVEKNFYRRCPPEKRPLHLRAELRTEDEPPLSDDDTEEAPTKAGVSTKTYDESLFKAIHRSFMKTIWVAGVLRLFSGPC